MSFNPLLLDKKIVLPNLDLAKMVFSLALRRVLPLANPVESFAQGFCFQSIFFVDGPLPPLFLTLIQEQMRGIKKEGLPLKRMEMMRSNAALFLKHHHFLERAELLEEKEDEVVPFVRLGDDLDEAFGESSLDDSSEMGVVQLLSVNELGDGFFEVLGTAFQDEKEAKGFVKAYKEEMKRLDGLQLFDEIDGEKVITSPMQIERREQLFHKVRAHLKAFGLRPVILLSDPLPENLDEIAYELTNKGVSPFFFSHTKDTGILFCPQGGIEKQLQKMQPWFEEWIANHSNLSFELEEERTAGGGKRMEWKIIDQIGRRLPGPSVEIAPLMRFSSPKKELLCHPIYLSLVGQLESWLTTQVL